MKIVVLKGSPRCNGNSNTLANEFIRGAKENGHEIYEFDCTRHHVNGCLGCDKCGMRNPCVQRDDFDSLRSVLIEADVIVFATPIYYFGVSGHLKNVIDRFYSAHDIMGHKKTFKHRYDNVIISNEKMAIGSADKFLKSANKVVPFDFSFSRFGCVSCKEVAFEGGTVILKTKTAPNYANFEQKTVRWRTL